MRRGRKPQVKPSHLKLVTGKPVAPIHVASDPIALEAWNRICDLLQGQGNLSLSDHPIIELYATTYSLYRRGYDVLSTIDIKNKDRKLIADDVRKNAHLCDRLLDQLTLTPSRRGKADSKKDNPSAAWKGLVVGA